MKRLIVLILCFAGWLAPLGAQSPAIFQMPQSQGPFPAILTEALNTPPSSKKYSQLLVNLIKDGKILYGTALNDYVDFVGDQLLKDYPQLQNQIHFFVALIPEVNAFALQNGVIVINAGLLAQVTNEAELAFVMAHEIAHISEHHEHMVVKRSKNKDYISKYLSYHQHSRVHEEEADRIGLAKFFANSNYSYDILDGIYDVLKYASLPFDNIPWPRNEVETNFYHFPDNYFLTNVSPISDMSGVMDTLSTHPNVEKRRAVAKAIASSLSNEGRLRFVQSEELFKMLNKQAKFICVDIFLQRHQYDKALYNTFVLQQQYPDDPFLAKTEVAAYYGGSKHKNNNSANSVFDSYREVEGEMQQVNHFYSKLTRNEWSVLALRKAWEANAKYPDDEYYPMVIKDLMSDIFVTEKMKYTDFCDYPQGIALEDIHDSVPAEQATADPNVSKYDRLNKNEQAKVLPDKKFKTVNYMLVDIHRDSSFYSLMNQAMSESVNEQILSAIVTPGLNNSKTMLVIPPTVRFYNGRNSERAKAADHYSDHLLKMMMRTTKKSNVEPVVVGSLTDKHPNTQYYNEVARWHRWLNDYDNADAMSMIYFTATDMEDIIDTVGGRNVCFASAVRKLDRHRSFNKYMYTIASLTNPIMIPIAAASYAIPLYDVRAQFVVVDVLNGKTQVAKRMSMNEASARTVMDNFIYTQLRSYLVH